MAVDADGAVAAAPGSGSLDGPAGLRVETVQLLTPEGERLEHPDYPLELSTDEVKGLYRDLVLVRRIDTEAIALQRQGELGIWASLLGQEPTWAASWPSREAQMPSSPWRCRAIASKKAASAAPVRTR